MYVCMYVCMYISYLYKDILDFICTFLVAKLGLQNHGKDGNYAP